jgi:dimethylhistidine N-methyltransferase
MANSAVATPLLDMGPNSTSFLHDTLAGLRDRPRQLPCKYLYDERGSQLFDRICDLDEYYPTRSELAIVDRYAQQMAAQIGPRVMLVELGSGSSVKTRMLLDHLCDPAAYVPVDISREHLQRTADELSAAYADIEVLPVCADFMQDFGLPVSQRRPDHCAVYFPGSTIGNLRPDEALELLRRIADLCGVGGGLLIGVDLQKQISVIEAAYNDDAGVTAEFNLNLLRRINRELGGDFDPEQFEHRAFYDEDWDRVEMHLVSQSRQEVTVGEESFSFEQGETICTEHSHKYTIDGFADLASEAGFTLRRHWTDKRQYFAVLHLVVVSGSGKL